jgi:hypothetical protein
MLAIAVAFALAAGTVLAQRDAASKIDGEAYEAPYFYDSVGAYQENALRHAVVLQQATTASAPVPEAVAKEHVEAIRTNVRAAQRHHASLKDTASDNKSAGEHFSALEEHHKKVLGLADEVDGKFEKGRADAVEVNKLSGSMMDELRAARGRHRRLAEPLGGEAPQQQVKKKKKKKAAE